jgi:hypothetical protein
MAMRLGNSNIGKRGRDQQHDAGEKCSISDSSSDSSSDNIVRRSPLKEPLDLDRLADEDGPQKKKKNNDDDNDDHEDMIVEVLGEDGEHKKEE